LGLLRITERNFRSRPGIGEILPLPHLADTIGHLQKLEFIWENGNYIENRPLVIENIYFLKKFAIRIFF